MSLEIAYSGLIGRGDVGNPRPNRDGSRHAEAASKLARPPSLANAGAQRNQLKRHIFKVMDRKRDSVNTVNAVSLLDNY